MGSTVSAEPAEEALLEEREKEERLGLVLFALDQFPLSGSPADKPDDGGANINELLPGGKIVGVNGGGGGINPYLPDVLGGGLGAADAAGMLSEEESLL